MTENSTDLPSQEQLRRELERLDSHQHHFGRFIFYSVLILSVLLLCLSPFVTVFRIYGSSMNPGLREGDMLVAINGGKAANGRILAVDVGGKLLIRRCIATEGQTVSLESTGSVSVDGVPLEEKYVTSLSWEPCDVAFPCTVPEGECFVLGDNRPDSVDSRSSSVGCVSSGQVVGSVVFRVWPLSGFGIVRGGN